MAISMIDRFSQDTTALESGLIVPTRSIQDLVKAEAKKQINEKNKSALFSPYLSGNNSTAYGAREKPFETPSFQMLYAASERSTLDRILIRSRTDQQKRIWQLASNGRNKEVGYRVVHIRHDDPDYECTADDLERCREMERLLSDPTPEEYTYLYPHQVRPHTRLKDLTAVLTRAELIIDRKVILRYKRRDGNGYSAFHWLPGETIKNVNETTKEWARKNEPGGRVTRDTVYRMSEQSGFDLTSATYLQVIDGMVVAAFTNDEISVHISNPSDRINRYGYGISNLEESLEITSILLMAFTYNKEMFKTNYPEQILTIAGDYDKEGLAAFKQHILAEAGGIGQNWRLPIIPAGDIDNFKIESVKLRESPKDMLFDQMIRMMCMLKAAAYGAHPSVLNLEIDSGSKAQTLNSGSQIGEIEFSKERSLIPSVTDMAEWLTDAIIKPRHDDLKLIVVGLKPEDEKLSIEIRTQRVSKWITRNEARLEEGLKAIGDLEDPKNPWNYPADEPLSTYMAMLAAQEAQNDVAEDVNASENGDANTNITADNTVNDNKQNDTIQNNLDKKDNLAQSTKAR